MVHKYVTYHIVLFIKENRQEKRRAKSNDKRKLSASRADEKESTKELSKESFIEQS